MADDSFDRPDHKIYGIIHKSKKSISTIDSKFGLKLLNKGNNWYDFGFGL